MSNIRRDIIILFCLLSYPAAATNSAVDFSAGFVFI
jgi:hypothetical protein